MNDTKVIDKGIDKKDWSASGETGIKWVDNKTDWYTYLPIAENQYKPKRPKSLLSVYDTSSCVSFAYCNTIEVQLIWMFPKLSTTAQNWLITNGYWKDGQCNFSDRFLAKMSKTTKEKGNSLPNVAEVARNVGLLPESDWKFQGDTWEEYMSEIPERLKKKALEFLEYFELPYERVWDGGSDSDRKEAFEHHLKQAPLFMSSYVCPKWSRHTLFKRDEVITGCPRNETGHATICYGVNDYYHIFDHYIPFTKRLSLDYPIKRAMKVIIQEKISTYQPFIPHVFNVNLKKGDRNSEVKFLQQFLIRAHCLKEGLDSGYYGDLTANAVLAFQKLHGVTTLWENLRYGGRVCGPKTREAINNLNHL